MRKQTNPKDWRPSQLAVWLGSTFDSMPPRVNEDVSHFIREGGLTGRAFMRLTERDLAEMGVNVKWRPMLLEARERLRKDSLAGRIMWGVAGPAPPSFSTPRPSTAASAGRDAEELLEVRIDQLSAEDRVMSWRETTGKKSRGSVKGLAAQFEGAASLASAGNCGSDEPDAILLSPRPALHDTPTTSTTSTASGKSDTPTASDEGDDTLQCTHVHDRDNVDEADMTPPTVEASKQQEEEHVWISASQLEQMQREVHSLKGQLDTLRSVTTAQCRHCTRPADPRAGADGEQTLASWSAMGSWTALATVGITLVLAESIANKLLRMLRSP